jgi:UDP-N-acetyl-D-glucosamine/UDP-N-acetyl-D-galactosamine dehydrogenase
VIVADPWADPTEVSREYGIQIGKVDADHQVDSLVVAVGHNQYRRLSPAELRPLCRGDFPVLADVKGLHDRHDAAKAGFTVFRL